MVRRDEIVHRDSRLAERAAQRPDCEFPVTGEYAATLTSAQHNMAAALPGNHEPETLRGLDRCVAGDAWQFSHGR